MFFLFIFHFSRSCTLINTMSAYSVFRVNVDSLGLISLNTCYAWIIDSCTAKPVTKLWPCSHLPLHMVVCDVIVVKTSSHLTFCKDTHFILYFSTFLTNSKAASGLYMILMFHVPQRKFNFRFSVLFFIISILILGVGVLELMIFL